MFLIRFIRGLMSLILRPSAAEILRQRPNFGRESLLSTIICTFYSQMSNVQRTFGPCNERESFICTLRRQEMVSFTEELRKDRSQEWKKVSEELGTGLIAHPTMCILNAEWPRQFF